MAENLPLFRQPFYFLRHGETERNRLGLIAGQADIELNETGWAQAHRAGALLAGRGIAALHASPLKRAHDTARCVARALGLEIVIVPELAERNWGELEGQPRGGHPPEATPPGGESAEDFACRTLAGLARIPEGDGSLVVAHSGTFRVLCNTLGIPRRSTPLENCLPLRFIPPGGDEGGWSVEPVA